MRTTQRWLGRRGSAAEFPPRSPDLTPPDFYLWGALKDTVYAIKPQTLEELRVQIEHACNDIPLATIQLYVVVGSVLWLKGAILNRGPYAAIHRLLIFINDMAPLREDSGMLHTFKWEESNFKPCMTVVRLKWAGHVARMGESRNAYKVLVGRPEGKRPLGRPSCRWEDNIKMDLREVGYDDREWINLAQDRDQWRAYVRTAMNLQNHLRALLLRTRSVEREFVSASCRSIHISGVRCLHTSQTLTFSFTLSHSIFLSSFPTSHTYIFSASIPFSKQM
ncbi:hypothetical protein ANN_22089 [Periplaneta americana]|uniref:Uncharacterized protein n=1 Tax=Periplaneta americana TaxID=6978 RepID=A0ABQ8S819_PERAM|nr:hypothetical protein ANN_22089 [Periplaneta americana]